MIKMIERHFQIDLKGGGASFSDVSDNNLPREVRIITSKVELENLKI